MTEFTSSVPLGRCQCGCGGVTKIATYNSAKYSYVKGQPYKYMLGHCRLHSREFTQARRSLWFWNKVKTLSDGCMIWKGAKSKHGYGTFWNGEIFERAHRFAYREKIGPIPEGLDLDHLCRNRLCVNPKHLEPVTRAENLRRGKRAKLTADDVRYIRSSRESHAALGRQFGVDDSTICDIRHFRLWKTGVENG